jgi:hypothetical protein
VVAPPAVDSRLPDEVRALLTEHVSSFERLEVLLLLESRREHWTMDEIAGELRLSVTLIAPACDSLVVGRLLFRETTGELRFAPAQELVPVCELLQRRYREDPLAVVRVISDLALERLRSSAARAFADAFRIRKPDGGE